MARTTTEPIDLTPDPEAEAWQVTRADVPPSMARDLTHADSDEDGGFTRSQWQAFRLPNGDLIVGFFPQDHAYHDVADETGI